MGMAARFRHPDMSAARRTVKHKPEVKPLHRAGGIAYIPVTFWSSLMT